jgi:hypothetical protein
LFSGRGGGVRRGDVSPQTAEAGKAVAVMLYGWLVEQEVTSVEMGRRLRMTDAPEAWRKGHRIALEQLIADLNGSSAGFEESGRERPDRRARGREDSESESESEASGSSRRNRGKNSGPNDVWGFRIYTRDGVGLLTANKKEGQEALRSLRTDLTYVSHNWRTGGQLCTDPWLVARSRMGSEMFWVISQQPVGGAAERVADSGLPGDSGRGEI